MAFSAAYGWRHDKELSYGAALKVIRQSIDDESGASAALDLGLLRSFRWRGGDYAAGLAVQNLGPGIKFVSSRYPLPLAFKSGLSRRFQDGSVLALEADKPVDNYPAFTLGGEYPLTARLALRAGYRWRLYGNELGAWSGFSAGAGVAFESVSFDYAFTPFGDLGNSHRFSLNYRFGGAPRRRAAQPAAQPAGLAGARDVRFVFEPHALVISPRGVKYAIKAAAADCDVYSMSFRTTLRGQAGTEFTMAEGSLSGAMLGSFPAGLAPLRALGTGELPGAPQGDVVFEFRVAQAAAPAGQAAFLYKTASGWQEAAVSRLGTDKDFYYFSAQAPAADYYAVAVRQPAGQ
jgi:hypothetical protein